MKEPLKPLNLTERGAFKGLRIIVDSTPDKLWGYYKHSFKPAFVQLLNDSDILKDVAIDFVETQIEKPSYSKAHTLCITAILEFEKPTMLSANVLIEKEAKGEGVEYAKGLMDEIIKLLSNDKVVLDEHHADQLLIFMSLANGTSTLSTLPLSLHSRTMLWLLNQFTPELEITHEENEGWS